MGYSAVLQEVRCSTTGSAWVLYYKRYDAVLRIGSTVYYSTGNTLQHYGRYDAVLKKILCRTSESKV